MPEHQRRPLTDGEIDYNRLIRPKPLIPIFITMISSLFSGPVQGRPWFDARGLLLNHDACFCCSRVFCILVTVPDEGTFTGFIRHTCSQ
jgi:hypothetical protein